VRSILIVISCICVAVVLLPACSKPAAPAAITKLAFGNTASAEPSVNSFEVDKVIYVLATVAGAVGKHNLNFEVTAENNVVSKDKGDHVMNKSIDFEGNQPLFLSFKIAFPGDYKIEAILTDPQGKQIDNRSGTITVTGEPPLPENDEQELDNDRDRQKETGKKDNSDRK
jgi:hypothetical protein